MMKRFLAAAFCLLSLTACGTTAETNTTEGYRVAIVQQLDHASMDEIRHAIEGELDALATEQALSLSYTDFSGQNDVTLLNQIGAQVVADRYDVIVPIATLAAQCMTVAAESTQTPIVYAAISNPTGAGLTDIPYVTGTSDALDTECILNMMLLQNPELRSVGLLYSLSEPNSTLPIAQAKAFLDEKGIAYVEKTGNTSDEILTAVSSLVGQVDAVFTPTDNTVMAVELTIAETLANAGIPHYAGADSFVRNGAFATCGVNYTELGQETARMVMEVLQNGTLPAAKCVSGGTITVNTDTAEALQLDATLFSAMEGMSLQTVQTTVE